VKKSILISSILTIFLFVGNQKLYAQKTKSQLEKEKKENLKKIKEANRILNDTKSKKTATIGKLTAIKQKLETTTKIINNVSEEITLIDAEILETESIIEVLESDLIKMKEEYATMAYSVQKTGNAIDKLTFLFSSKSFNQMLMRMKYFEQYNEMRKKQIKAISHVDKILIKEHIKLSSKRFQKSDLLSFKVQESDNLSLIKHEHDEMVNELTKQETQIVNDLEERKQSVQRLDRMIADIVKKEIEKSIAEAKAKAEAELKKRKAEAKTPKEKAKIEAEEKSGLVIETPETKQINTNFQANRSILIWPTRHGFISQGFGRKPHPILKGVVIENLGVDIQTNKNEAVRCVFDGKISAVANVPGMGMVVMIQHGTYYTVYARLKNVVVVTGQKIKAKEAIGEVSEDNDELNQLQFQIWRGNEKLNPEEWLLKK
jgi:murein hydrolase activator